MSREQTVRDVAYAIWEAEGKPEGRDATHWQQAEARVAASVAGGKTAGGKTAFVNKAASVKKTDAKTAETKTVEAKAKLPAKAAATKAAPKTKS
ncbi:DUF2934 domain-containing protein [Bosea sp. (in: a-proteobacteria)]|uniref:DUF2934 domain-containing protein n=1 Tax=Bosea sp. (in: a-proteobacteria) TaxID=1871050 RepID=UPI003566818C